MDDRAEMNRHVEAAIRELDAAARSGDCGVCSSLIRGEAENLTLLLDLSGKVEEFVAAQERTHSSLSEGNARADRELGPRPAGTARRANGLGVVDMVSEMWRTRVRVADVLTLGGRR